VKLVVLVSMLAMAVAAPRVASAAIYNLHLGGVCSHGWTDGKGTDAFGRWSGETTIDVVVDMKDSIPAAAARLEPYFNQYCSGADTCFVYTYSAGDAVVGYLFANRATNWNVGFVNVVAGAGGGSRLAGDIAALLGCPLANDLTESNVRNAYNHNDTNAEMVYRLGGYKELFESRIACVTGSALNWLSFGLVDHHCLSGKNDGAVEYHSAGGYSTAGVYADFWNSGSHWAPGYSQSYLAPSGSDEGRGLNHYELKALGICLEGGIAGFAGLAQCTTFANGTHPQ
jgi:hypothetical protein